jgi:dihydroneopterin aldolase/2-amino-4-hydroxy-6-hydroxymethyldihydropteridine diphosphokinase
VSDRIEIRGIRALGVHGALPSEQDQPQPFELDLLLEADLEPAGCSDDLATTVDYGRVAVEVCAVVASERHQLLESLAASVARCVLAEERVVAVTVVVRKLRPPVPVDVGSVGVRITRRLDHVRRGET